MPFVGYFIAYHTYGRFLARKIFKLDDSRAVPSKELEDGIDYVPSRKIVIFGHHYTSIAGTGPIVGPAIGIIWGWVPAILWVVVGSVVMGAVHDFGSLVVSLRNQGKSISEVSARYINPRARTIFFCIIFLGLLIVIAIFGVVIATLFMLYPGSVFPIWMEIPIAIALGYAVHKREGNVAFFSTLAVVGMYITVFIGFLHFSGLRMPAVGGIPPTGVWTIILLIYAYFASTLPVTTLLQPRDYINACQLFVIIGVLCAGTIIASSLGKLHIVAPAVNLSPEGAPPVWPFLFVTIACGAVSGFHSLVASGTTAKEIAKESDTQFVGYGSMLLEATLATLVIIAVCAGIGMGYKMVDGSLLRGENAWLEHYSSWTAAKGLKAKLDAVVVGSANILQTLGISKGLGMVLLGVFIASFAGTTLDTATRIQRYVIGELSSNLGLPSLSDRWIATLVAVGTAGALAFATGADGKGALILWPMFGAVNQLLAGLALLTVTMYLRRRGGYGYLVSGLPCLFMLFMTIWAVVSNELSFFKAGKWLLTVINGATLLLALWMVFEAWVVFFKTGAGVRETLQHRA